MDPMDPGDPSTVAATGSALNPDPADASKRTMEMTALAKRGSSHLRSVAANVKGFFFKASMAHNHENSQQEAEEEQEEEEEEEQEEEEGSEDDDGFKSVTARRGLTQKRSIDSTSSISQS